MKRTASDRAIDRLIDAGWTVSHNAYAHGYLGYTTAGTVVPMQTRKGYEYCRVFDSRSQNVHVRPGVDIRVQRTTVLKRPITA